MAHYKIIAIFTNRYFVFAICAGLMCVPAHVLFKKHFFHDITNQDSIFIETILMGIYGPIVVDDLIELHMKLSNEMEAIEFDRKMQKDVDALHAISLLIRRSYTIRSISKMCYRHDNSKAREYIQSLLSDHEQGLIDLPSSEINEINQEKW